MIYNIFPLSNFESCAISKWFCLAYRRDTNKRRARIANVNLNRTTKKGNVFYLRVPRRPFVSRRDRSGVTLVTRYVDLPEPFVCPSVCHRENNPRRLFDFRLWLTAESVQSLPRLSLAFLCDALVWNPPHLAERDVRYAIITCHPFVFCHPRIESQARRLHKNKD